MTIKQEMDAWVKSAGSYGFVFKKILIPEIMQDELLIQVKAVGICGTDIGIYTGKRKVPNGLVPGHEFCGVVVKAGDAVEGVKVGDLVTSGIIINCGLCQACRSGFEAQCENILEYGIHVNGAFAEFIAVKAKTVHMLPVDFSVIKGASIEPVAVTYNIVKKISSIGLNKAVLIYGPGPIGLYTTQLLVQMGFKHVVMVGLVENRLRVARQLGAYTINAKEENVSERFREITGKKGADVIIEATGNGEVLKSCTQLLLPHGTLVVAGIFHEMAFVDMFSLVRNENRIIGSFCYSYDDYAQAVGLAIDGKINFDLMVSHTMPLSALDQGMVLSMEEKAIKVVLEL